MNQSLSAILNQPFLATKETINELQRVGAIMQNLPKEANMPKEIEANAKEQIAEVVSDDTKKSDNTQSVANAELELKLAKLERQNEKLEALSLYASKLSDDEMKSLKAQDIGANEVKDFVLEKLTKDTKTVSAFIEVGENLGKNQAKVDVEDALLLSLGGECDTSTDKSHKLAQSNSLRAFGVALGLNSYEMSNNEFSAAMTTSDFPVLLRQAIDRKVMADFDRAEVTYNKLVDVVPHRDFKTKTEVGLTHLDGDIWKDQVEKGEPKEFGLSEEILHSKIASKSAKFSLTREMLINDDLGQIGGFLTKFGNSAALHINRAVYNFINASGVYANYKMNDGKAYFHADHKNIATTAGKPSEAILSAMRVQMMRQVDNQGNAIRVTPRKLLVPPELIDVAQRLMVSPATLEANLNAGVVNIHQRAYEIISDQEMLDANAWFMLANGAIKLGVLAGTNGKPVIEMVRSTYNDGVEYVGTLDYSVYATRHQYAIKNLGV